jgi:hypothetical protein
MSSPAPPCPAQKVDAASFGSEVLRARAPVLLYVGDGTCADCPVAGMGGGPGGPGAARRRCLEAPSSPDLAARLGVTHLPTILVIRGGKIVRRLVGRPLPDALEAALREAAIPPEIG